MAVLVAVVAAMAMTAVVAETLEAMGTATAGDAEALSAVGS
jgi:hypothetical protein